MQVKKIMTGLSLVAVLSTGVSVFAQSAPIVSTPNKKTDPEKKTQMMEKRSLNHGQKVKKEMMEKRDANHGQQVKKEMMQKKNVTKAVTTKKGTKNSAKEKTETLPVGTTSPSLR